MHWPGTHNLPIFSVVLPTYNRIDLLQEAIASVHNQTFQDYELLVVDDGSSDGTTGFLQKHGGNLRYISSQHSGPGAARNAALAAASGRWVAFLDSDDAWFPWTLATYHAAIEEHPKGVFFTGTAIPWEARDTAKNCTPSSSAHPDLLSAATGDMPPVSGTPSICIRADVLRASGGFVTENIHAEDVDLWLRLGSETQFVQIHCPPVFAQRKHAGNVTHDLGPGVAGAKHLIQNERTGAYPGGVAYARKRQRIIAANARSVILSALRAGRASEAWCLFRQTFDWQVQQKRWLFLAAFPWLLFLGLSRKP